MCLCAKQGIEEKWQIWRWHEDSGVPGHVCGRCLAGSYLFRSAAEMMMVTDTMDEMPPGHLQSTKKREPKTPLMDSNMKESAKSIRGITGGQRPTRKTEHQAL
ncbi:hypothetical protein H1C71_042155 [Ictidomys tridecemlineatus]|nr:hypothetical protein H1C71_042155 [Ictidomys tridecemlineatus]